MCDHVDERSGRAGGGYLVGFGRILKTRSRIVLGLYSDSFWDFNGMYIGLYSGFAQILFWFFLLFPRFFFVWGATTC